MKYDPSKVKAIEIRADGFNTYGYDEESLQGYCNATKQDVVITTKYRAPNKSMAPLITLFDCDKTQKKFEESSNGNKISWCYNDERCNSHCSCHGCLAACGDVQKWKDSSGEDHAISAKSHLDLDVNRVAKLAENNAWSDLFDLSETYGFSGFTEDFRYSSAKDKILKGKFPEVTKEEYKHILGALKSAEDKLSKSPSQQDRESAYFIRRMIYHGKEMGFNGFADLKDKYGGCYIATVAYGSYDAPQVLILRDFRDSYLDTRSWGQKFIHVYYKCSPYIASKLMGKARINAVLRIILNKVISIWVKRSMSK